MSRLSTRGPEQPSGLQVRTVRRAAQWDGLHRPQGEQPEVLAVPGAALSEAPALQAVQPALPHHSVDRPPAQPQPDEVETFRPPQHRAEDRLAGRAEDGGR